MKLEVIHGDRDETASLWNELHSAPHQLSQADFERAIDVCRAQLSIDDILELIARRVRDRVYSDRLEQNALLSIIEGRYENAERLFGLRDRRDKLGLKITS